MTLTKAAIYFGLWWMVCFFAICWLRHFGLLVFMKIWEHVLLALCFAFLLGGAWYMFARDFKYYLY